MTCCPSVCCNMDDDDDDYRWRRRRRSRCYRRLRRLQSAADSHLSVSQHPRSRGRPGLVNSGDCATMCVPEFLTTLRRYVGSVITRSEMFNYDSDYTSGRFVKQEQWERWRAKRKLVSGSKHRGVLLQASGTSPPEKC